MLLNIAWFTLVFAAVYWLPGRLLVGLLPELRREEAFVFSVGIGIVVINTLSVLVTGVLGLAAPVFLDAWTVAGVATFVGALALTLRWRRGERPRLMSPRWPAPRQIALAGLTFAAFAFYLFHYDALHMHEDTCMVRSSMSILLDWEGSGPGAGDSEAPSSAPIRGDDPGGGGHGAGGEGPNRFLAQGQGQRLGPAVLIAPLLALFGVFGLMLTYALQGLLLPGLGFVIGRRLFDRDWAAWLLAVLLAFSPYGLEVQVFDENFLALIVGSLVLALLLREHPSALAAGAAMALFLGVRHVGALLLPPALLYVVFSGRFRRGDGARFVGALALFGLVYAIRHAFLLGDSGMLMEPAMDRDPAPHSLFGLLPFQSRVLWNWPFVAEPLRSPYNAYANLIAFPLDFIRRYGVLLLALVPPGVMALLRRDRASAWLLLGWWTPIVALVMMKSNWVEPNKMGIPATVLTPFVIAMAAGATWLLDRGVAAWRRLAVLGTSVAASLLFVGVASGQRAPVDARILEYMSVTADHVVPAEHSFVPENEDYVGWDRERYGVHWLPELNVAHWHPALLRERWQRVARTLTSPGFEDFEGDPIREAVGVLLGRPPPPAPISAFRAIKRGEARATRDDEVAAPAPEARRVFALALARSPVLAEDPLRPVEGAPAALRVDGRAVTAVTGLAVSWSRLPVTLFALRSRLGAVHLFFISLPPPRGEVRSDGVPVMVRDASALPEGDVVLDLPADAIVHVSEIRWHGPRRMYTRAITLSGGVPWASPTHALFF